MSPTARGSHYNERIAADARQARLGWSERIEVSRDGHVMLQLSRGDGHPVTGLAIGVVLGRPSTNRLDVKLTLAEAAPGRYEAQTAQLAGGSWLIVVEARTEARAADPVYRARRRLWLKP